MSAAEIETDLVLIGYGHASMVGILRPDIAHPKRKIKAARAVTSTITAEPCACRDDHVEIWARRVPAMDVDDYWQTH